MLSRIQICSKTSKFTPTLKLFVTVSKTAVISLVSIHLTQKQFPHVQLILLQHHMTFHNAWLKGVWENEGIMFCFVLTLWPSAKLKVSDNNGRSQTMPNSTAGMNKFGWKVCTKYLAFLPCKTTAQTNRTNYIDPYGGFPTRMVYLKHVIWGDSA